MYKMPTATTNPPLPTTAYPGLLLGPTSSYLAGPGTYVHQSQVIASISGQPITLPTTSATTSKSNKAPSAKSTISVPNPLPSPTYAPIPSPNISNTNILPKVGSVVLAKVVRVRTRQVDAGILCVGDIVKDAAEGNNNSIGWYGGEMNVCADEWPAVVRREDIRATEKEKVICTEGFKVGDVVRGVVISLGDQANYYLTTAKNELGVIMARSEVGNMMQPISWKEFRDPVTGLKEGRKVAKPF
ncbi:MAG: hypothetical protein Q9217_006056 [Psora testacea]